MSDAATEAEKEVNRALAQKSDAEKNHAEAQWEYSQKKQDRSLATGLRGKVDKRFLELYKAKAKVEEMKEKAKTARIAYRREVAQIEAN